MTQYTKAHLLEQLSLGELRESETVECKAKWQRSYGKSFSAIGNGDHRGWLIVGIDDRGRLCGKDVHWAEKQAHEIENHICQYLEPYATVSVSTELVKKSAVVLIEITNPNSIVSWNQKFYKRVGASSMELPLKEQKLLELSRLGFDFSDMEYGGETDPALVLSFAKFLNKDNGDWTSLPVKEILSKLQIQKKNVAGILFGDFSFRVVHYNAQSEILEQWKRKAYISYWRIALFNTFNHGPEQNLFL